MIRPPDNKSFIDRRALSRDFCSLEAFVVPGPHLCTVVDKSETGLRLRFQTHFDGWTKVTVVLMASGQAFAASAKWRRGAEVGVSITAHCDLNGFVPSGFAEARQVWNRLKSTGRQEGRTGQGA